MIVTVDGKKIKDVNDFSVYMYKPYDSKDENMCCSVRIGTLSKEDNGLITNTYITKSSISDSPPQDDSFLAKAMDEIQTRLKK